MNVDLEEIQQKIEETVKKGKAAAAAGPDLPYTSRAKKVLELAMSEARELNHSYVGTEHLLLGLLREEKGIAARSEEHTSELQSHLNLVCRLLLEKKKKYPLLRVCDCPLA